MNFFKMASNMLGNKPQTLKDAILKAAFASPMVGEFLEKEATQLTLRPRTVELEGKQAKALEIIAQNIDTRETETYQIIGETVYKDGQKIGTAQNPMEGMQPPQPPQPAAK